MSISVSKLKKKEKSVLSLKEATISPTLPGRM